MMTSTNYMEHSTSSEASS